MRQVNQLRRFIIKSTLVLTLFSSVSSTGISALADAPLPSLPEQYLFAAANREGLRFANSVTSATAGLSQCQNPASFLRGVLDTSSKLAIAAGKVCA